MSTPSTPPAVVAKPLRRRSIFSGVLLIGLGVLFLYHNFRGGFDLLELLNRWWPLLLIFWGLTKLYDHFAARRTGQVAPRAITGGDIFLVFFTIALAASVGGADWTGRRGNFDFGAIFPHEPYTFSEELPAQPLKADSPVNISTDYGDITVVPQDAAELRVRIKKSARAGGEGEAKRLADKVSVAVSKNGDATQIGTQTQGGRVRVDLEVLVPKRASITARAPRGEIHVGGVAGSVNAEARNGNIEVRDAGGDVGAQIAHGDVHVVDSGGNVRISGRGGQIEVANVKGEATVDGSFYGPITIAKVGKGARFVSGRTDLTVSRLAGRFEASSGKLEISDAPGSVALVTNKNDVSLENVTGRIHIENKAGNVELRFTQPPKEDIEVSTESGNVELVLPAKSTFEVHAEARQGDIDAEFSDQLAKQVTQTQGSSRLDGKIGAKGPQIKLKTTYGAIRLHKSE